MHNTFHFSPRIPSLCARVQGLVVTAKPFYSVAFATRLIDRMTVPPPHGAGQASQCSNTPNPPLRPLTRVRALTPTPYPAHLAGVAPARPRLGGAGQLETTWGRHLCLHSIWFQPHAIWHVCTALLPLTKTLVSSLFRLPRAPAILSRARHWMPLKA
jgi:hypothetical protein